MEVPQLDRLCARPAGQEAVNLVRAACMIAGRYIQVCANTPGTTYTDTRANDPRLESEGYGKWLARAGLFIGCIGASPQRPQVVLSPWGQWGFAAAGAMGEGLTFLENDTFMDGLKLGDPLVPPGRSLVHVYPVLSLRGFELLHPLLYNYIGNEPEQAVQRLTDEWRRHFVAAAP